ncbi:glycosyltransferase family 2 protein [Sutterella megalosphaeroides]|uniref:Glycosyltransferase 2-like domain-containing protein n=1 Tax=Sutterella megalosphaeroides TaxID=2494234 RepID=A0A2Z6IAD0_9BURK|nr:glycosyltransferase [Sutterella megalosphaeroides]BBF22557.1 hypothetical protein SUTMEG_04480 [Sutterella megalosphaeroides]
MSSTPDLSICITFRNQDCYIEPLLIKLLGLADRSRYSWEILVGLDHATSQGLANAERIAQDHPNIRIITLKSDSNLIPLSRASTNRLHLLKKAQGTYALLLDGDDEYLDVFDEAIDFLNKTENLAFVGCAHQYVEFHENTQQMVKVTPPYSDGAVVEYLKHASSGKYFSFNTVVFRRQIGLDALQSAELYCNDTTLTKLLLKKGLILFSHKEVMSYRMGLPSIFSGASNAARLLSQIIVQEENLRLFPELQEHTLKSLMTLVHSARKIRGNELEISYGIQPRARGLLLSSLVYKLMQPANPIMHLLLHFKLKLVLKEMFRNRT